MSLFLTDRQKNDLEEAVLDYLTARSSQYSQTIESFKVESGVTSCKDAGKGVLEKKWTSVIRLQKKVMELEAKVEQLQRRGGGGGSVADNAGEESEPLTISQIAEGKKLLPKAPAKSCLAGHRGAVTCAAMHPVYSICATGSEDSTIRIWDHETGQFERTMKGHTGAVTGLAFDARGSHLASCSNDLSAKLWDTTNTYSCIKTIKGHEHSLSAVLFSPSGDHLLTCSRDSTVKMWDSATGFCSRTYAGHSDWVKTIAISGDGQYLASAGMDQTIIIWLINTGKSVQTLRGHEHVIESLSYGKKPTDVTSALSAAISSSSNGATIGEAIPTESKAAASDSMNDYSYLASGSRDRTVRLWDPLRGECLMIFTAHENWVRGVIIHRSGKYIISCSDDKTIRVMDAKEGRCMRTISDAHGHFVNGISMSAMYPVLVSVSVDKNVCVWNCV